MCTKYIRTCLQRSRTQLSVLMSLEYALAHIKYYVLIYHTLVFIMLYYFFSNQSVPPRTGFIHARYPKIKMIRSNRQRGDLSIHLYICRLFYCFPFYAISLYYHNIRVYSDTARKENIPMLNTVLFILILLIIYFVLFCFVFCFLFYFLFFTKFSCVFFPNPGAHSSYTTYSARCASAECDRRGRQPHVDTGPVAASDVRPKQWSNNLLQGNGHGKRYIGLRSRTVPSGERHYVHAGRSETVDRLQNMGIGRYVRRRRSVLLSDYGSHPRRR